MKCVRVRLAAVAVAAALAATGCSPGGGSKGYPVRGKVTFEGEPVAQGFITFKVGGASGKAFSGEIKNGEYSVHVDPGQAVVEISATRVVPGKFDTSNGTKEPYQESYIPAKYNTATKLTAEIKPETNDIPFELKK